MITNYNNAGTVVFHSDGENLTHTTEYKLSNWKPSINKVTLRVGNQKSYKVNVHPSRMIDTMMYTSSDPDIAYPDPATGKIYAVSPGSCVITVTAFDNSQREIQVTVRPKK